MTWPLAAVIIVGILCVTVAIILPLFITWRHAPMRHAGVHYIAPDDEQTRIRWPQREEAHDPQRDA